MRLSSLQWADFDRDGYLIIPNAFSEIEAKQLQERAKLLIDTQLDLSQHPGTRFSTRDDQGSMQGKDQYFLDSAARIHFFFEEEADLKTNTKETLPLLINKIGHGLHLHDPIFRAFTERWVDMMRSIPTIQQPVVLQSMVIFKQPRIGGRVNPHQDSTFLFTDPPSAIGFWFALEDCTAENGTLSFIPGSHKTYPLHRRFVRQSQANGQTQLVFQPLGPQEEQPISSFDPSLFKTEIISKGSLVLIHGAVVHQSEANRSGHSRHAYAFHIIDGKAHYPADNWLQMTEKDNELQIHV